jgi:curved DNA-binding protein CbpA
MSAPSFDVSLDHFAVLGVPRGASHSDISKAFRSLARVYHPDKFKGNAEEGAKLFQRLSEAHETLSDAEKRREYEAELEAGRSAAATAFGAPGVGGAMRATPRPEDEARAKEVAEMREKLRRAEEDAARRIVSRPISSLPESPLRN